MLLMMVASPRLLVITLFYRSTNSNILHTQRLDEMVSRILAAWYKLGQDTVCLRLILASS